MPKIRKTAVFDIPGTVHMAATNYSPVIRDLHPEQLPGTMAATNFTPLVSSFPFRQMVAAKWRTGEYTCPDGYDIAFLDTVAILSPRKSEDPHERQIQQLNYNNFINVMAEMIQKYAPKIQKLQEESK